MTTYVFKKNKKLTITHELIFKLKKFFYIKKELLLSILRLINLLLLLRKKRLNYEWNVWILKNIFC